MARQTPVLICGAGPVGLALAVELGTRGVACTVIEKNDRVGYAPRAKTTHTRTREHMRRWGIAEDLAAAAPFGVDYPSDVFLVTRLNGYPLAKFEDAFHCAPARNPLYAETCDVRVASAGTGNSAATARQIVGLLDGAWQRGNAGAAA